MASRKERGRKRRVRKNGLWKSLDSSKQAVTPDKPEWIVCCAPANLWEAPSKPDRIQAVPLQSLLKRLANGLSKLRILEEADR